MLPRKILKVETKICAVWGILEANLKKSSTLKFIMNISFLTSICVRRSIILIFIGEKVCLSIFFQRKNFFSTIFDFHFRENPRFRDETGKNQNNMKQTWNKRTIKQNADLLVRTGSSRDTRNRKPGTESLTRHIDLLDAVTHTHLRFANLAKHKQVSTFSFSHLQNFHLFFTDASISDTSAFSPFASTTRKDEIYDLVVGSLSGQVFQSSCHHLQVRGTLLIRIQNGRQSAYNP